MMPDAIVLCGGAGTRLRSVTGTAPKAMAIVAGRPFMEFLLLQLRRYGYTRVILSVGYQQQVIRDHFAEKAFDLNLSYSSESSPLGTGGALRQAIDLVKTDIALVMNGDSYTDLDLCRFAFAHQKHAADLTVAVVAEDRTDAGSVLLGDHGRITAFAEKRPVVSSRYRSAGIYMISRSLAASIPQAVQISLEEQLLPLWIQEGRHIRAFVHPGTCIDIGTPERYQGAQDFLANFEAAAMAPRSEGQP